MGTTFGLSDELTAQVVRYFLPPIIKSITKRTETSRGLLHFLEFVGNHRNDQYWDDPEIFNSPKVEDEGCVILSMLFSNPEQIVRIVENRAKVLPVSAPVLDMMFPYIAILALAAIEQRTREPLAKVLQYLGRGRIDPVSAANPYKPLVGELRRRAASGSAKRGGLGGMFGTLFSRGEGRNAARSAA
jgi:hypothetical protein